MKNIPTPSTDAPAMKGNSTFTIKNTQTGWSKSGMSFLDVKKFHFSKMQKSNFNPIAMVDYQVIDEVNSEVFNMSNMTL